jgi:hypothetical protein
MRRGAHVLGLRLALPLIDQGWQLNSGLGKPIALTHGARCIDPFKTVFGLATGDLNAAEWNAQPSVAGISGRLSVWLVASRCDGRMSDPFVCDQGIQELLTQGSRSMT